MSRAAQQSAFNFWKTGSQGLKKFECKTVFTQQQKHGIQIRQTQFNLNNDPAQACHFVKVNRSGQRMHSNNEFVHEVANNLWHFLQTNFHNKCVLGTTKTTDSQDKKFETGHNFMCLFNPVGNMVCEISKRPDAQKVLRKSPSIFDSRFAFTGEEKISMPRFTTTEAELRNWARKVCEDPNYALFLSAFPLGKTFGITSEEISKNVTTIQTSNQPYTLKNCIDNQGNNCNLAVVQAILGPKTYLEGEHTEPHSTQVTAKLIWDILVANRLEHNHLSAAMEKVFTEEGFINSNNPFDYPSSRVFGLVG